jgi:hypothetical protein
MTGYEERMAAHYGPDWIRDCRAVQYPVDWLWDGRSWLTVWQRGREGIENLQLLYAEGGLSFYNFERAIDRELRAVQ